MRKLVNEKTRAIVCVHYGGLPSDMDELLAIGREYNIPVIEDAAHALGATYKGKYVGSIADFTMFSFQAIKTITTGDGGMLVVKITHSCPKASGCVGLGLTARNNKRERENDITEVGYKYQMTDMGAAMGLAALKEFDETLAYRQQLFAAYLSKDWQVLRDTADWR